METAAMQNETLLAMSIVIFVALLPVLAWRKTRRTAPIVAVLYVLFAYIYRDFVFAKVTASHDTYWALTYWYSLIRQWVTEGVSLGWNPYLGGGQPLYLFSNYILQAQVFVSAKLFLWFNWDFSNEQFFSLVWTFNHLFLVTGVYLFFCLRFKSVIFGLFGMSTFLLGGLFWSELFQFCGWYFTAYYWPLLLFLIILFWKYEQQWGLYLFFSFLGIAINYYIPSYLVAYFLLFLISYFLVNVHSTKYIFNKLYRIFKEKPYALPISIFLFLMASATFFYTCFEMQAYVSPTRCFAFLGQIASNYGFQPSCIAPLKSTLTLFDSHIYTNSTYLNHLWLYATHTYFYIGLLPFVTFLIAVYFLFVSSAFRKRTGVLFVGAVLLIILAAGDEFPMPLWKWLHTILPFNTIRHTFPFARMASFLLIIIAFEGLRELLEKCAPLYQKEHYLGSSYSRLQIGIISALLIIHILSLAIFSLRMPAKLDSIPKYSLSKFQYPNEWRQYGTVLSPIPMDLTPLVTKEAIWTHLDYNSMFLLNKDFIPILRYATREYFSNGLFFHQLDNKLHKKDFLLPIMEHGKINNLSDMYSKFGLGRKNTFSPIYATVETNAEEKTVINSYKAIDGNFNSYWKIDKAKKRDSITWLSITFPDEIKCYGIRITPHKASELWRDKRAKIQISKHGKEWKDLLKLDLSAAIANNDNLSFLFPLNTPVTGHYFRLWVEDENFTSLSEIEFIDEPIIDKEFMLSINEIDIVNVDIVEVDNLIVSDSSHHETNTGELAFDGNLSTFWHVAVPPTSDTHSISIKFPTFSTFNGVQFTPRQDESQMWGDEAKLPCAKILGGVENAGRTGCKDYKLILQTSRNGKKWIDVEVIQEELAYGKKYLFALKNSITTKYIRLCMHDLSRKFLSVAEIQFVRLSKDSIEESSPLLGVVGTVEPLVSNNPNKIYLKVHAEKDANLVRLENYHRGWRVYVDSKEVAMQKFGPNLQLIPISAGDHKVYLEFSSYYNTLVWLHVWFYMIVFLCFIIYLAKLKLDW
jgi:hypothetical protein